MIYSIDYRNGSMGNTILAHALYACHCVDLDLNIFFSNSGNAHLIQKLNKTNLTAEHALEKQDLNDTKIILTVKCSNWYEVLRKKMSYSKWHSSYPAENNFKQFNFSEPTSDQSWLENLTVKYFDSYYCNLTYPNAPVLELEDYLTDNIDLLIKSVTPVLLKQWDYSRSKMFHATMIEKNKNYLDWLHYIQQIVNRTVLNIKTDVELLFWEKAIVISMVCYQHNINPNRLHWNNYGCFLDKNNVSLIESVQRTKHGKTI